jgi:hypothetical protein
VIARSSFKHSIGVRLPSGFREIAAVLAALAGRRSAVTRVRVGDGGTGVPPRGGVRFGRCSLA